MTHRGLTRHSRNRCFVELKHSVSVPLPSSREAGWSLTPKRFGVSDHPVSAASEASRHFLSGGATPTP